MTATIHPFDPDAWVKLHFSGSDLKHARRNARLDAIALKVVTSPGDSLLHIFNNWSEVRCTYGFFSHQAVTPAGVQAVHRNYVLDQMNQPDPDGRPVTILIAEDTSDISFRRSRPTEGLERAGDKRSATKQSFSLHTSLAVRVRDEDPTPGRRPALEVFGLPHQEFYTPQPRPAEEKAADPTGQRLARAARTRPRASDLWLRGGEALGHGPTDPTVRWVCLADRGADYYEYLCDRRERNLSFVVRSCHDRVLIDAATGERRHRLRTRMAARPALGSFVLELHGRPAQNGRPAEPARTATLSVSADTVLLAPPERKGAQRPTDPLPCQVVRVWEADPPEGVEPLEWLLLTDLDASTFDQAHLIVRYYAARWVIEEYHKALKSGLNVEKLQLRTGNRLKNAVAVMAVVAVRLLALRELARTQPDAPPEQTGLSGVALKVLSERLNRPLSTSLEVLMGLANLGGHMGRKSDGLPGWQTLYRGWRRLSDYLVGVEIAQDRREAAFRERHHEMFLALQNAQAALEQWKKEPEPLTDLLAPIERPPKASRTIPLWAS